MQYLATDKFGETYGYFPMPPRLGSFYWFRPEENAYPQYTGQITQDPHVMLVNWFESLRPED